LTDVLNQGQGPDTNPKSEPTPAPSLDPDFLPTPFHNQVQVQVQVKVPGVSPKHPIQPQHHTNVVERVSDGMGRVSSTSTIDFTKEDDAIDVAYFNASQKNPTPKPIGFIPKQESLNSVRILFPSPTRSFDVKLSSEVFSTHHTDSIELPASTPLIPDVIHLTHPQNFLNKLHLAQS